MPTVREEVVARLKDELAKLEDDAAQIQEAADLLRGSIDELSGDRSGKYRIGSGTRRKAPKKKAPTHRRVKVNSQGQFVICTQKGTPNERAFLEALDHFGGEASGDQINHYLGTNSGTNYGAFTRLEKAGYARRNGESKGRSWIHVITAAGRARLEQAREFDAEAERRQGEPNGNVATESKPEPEKQKKDTRPHEEKVAAVLAALNNGPLAFEEWHEKSGVNRTWIRNNIPLLMERGQIVAHRTPDSSIPAGYRVKFERRREAVARPGEGVAQGRLAGE